MQFGSTHINELASYLKIDTTRIPVVILRGSDRVKLVLKMSAKSITSADLISFIKDQASQKQYTFDEDVTEDTPEDTDL